MSLITKINNFLFNKRIRFDYLQKLGFYNHLNDEVFLKKKFKIAFGYELNLKNPQTYSEKLQWLKLHDRNNKYSIMVDKVLAKKYVAGKIGKQYIIPTLCTWDSVDEIDFDKLPNQFVLKCNHNSGQGMYVCKNKNDMNIKTVKKNLNKGMKQDYYLCNREWPYKNVDRKILAEKYMVDGGQDECLTDYKFFCFDGEPQFMYISKDAAECATTDFFDMDFNFLPIKMKDPNSKIKPEKPEAFEEMKRLARILSSGCPHVRVDFYYINGQIYFGELTFYHNGGFGKVNPIEWNKKIGDYIDIQKIRT